MTTLEIVMAVAGSLVTAMVVVGMILLTPSGSVPVGDEMPQSDESPAGEAPPDGVVRGTATGAAAA